jgi:hypothetical protein
MTGIDYGQEIRDLADAYEGLTGKNPFVGVEDWTPEIKTYKFPNRTFSKGEDAVHYMRELLRVAVAEAKE